LYLDNPAKENIMKKKMIIIPLASVLSISLVACSSGASQQAGSQTGTQQQTATATASATTASVQSGQQQTTQQIAPRQANLLPAKIISVIDGDTMKVKVNGKEETIRLLLVDTPETKHPNKPVQPFGPEASVFAKKTLEGKDVQIEIDVSERDKYGRLLAYLWIDGKMFNEMLLEKGLARVAYIYSPNVKYVDQFREIQKKAQIAGVGIWSIENYAQEDGYHTEVSATKKVEQQPKEQSKQTSAPSSEPSSDVYFKTCKDARAAGAAPLHTGDPGYRSGLDRDGDGIACE
jgi:micrococcal nuclease